MGQNSNCDITQNTNCDKTQNWNCDKTKKNQTGKKLELWQISIIKEKTL